MKKRCLVLISIGLCFTCCSTAPEMRIIQDTFSIDEQFDRVWPAIIEVFAERKLSIATIEKDSGIIVSEWIVLSDDLFHYADCGKGSPFPLDVIEVKFNIFLKSITINSSEIKINALFKTGKKECVSTGLFERDMYDLINAKTN